MSNETGAPPDDLAGWSVGCGSRTKDGEVSEGVNVAVGSAVVWMLPEQAELMASFLLLAAKASAKAAGEEAA